MTIREDPPTDAYAARRAVARWLSIRAQHIEESQGISNSYVPRDRQKALFTQLAADADHSDLLVRLLRGEEPLPFAEWRRRDA